MDVTLDGELEPPGPFDVPDGPPECLFVTPFGARVDPFDWELLQARLGGVQSMGRGLIDGGLGRITHLIGPIF